MTISMILFSLCLLYFFLYFVCRLLIYSFRFSLFYTELPTKAKRPAYPLEWVWFELLYGAIVKLLRMLYFSFLYYVFTRDPPYVLRGKTPFTVVELFPLTMGAVRNEEHNVSQYMCLLN
jgi:hypothetical protein